MDRSSGPLASSIRRLWGWARRHWIISTIGVAAAVGLGVWLIFFFFAVQTLFIDEEVDEALPTFGAPAAPAEAPAAAPATEPAAPARLPSPLRRRPLPPPRRRRRRPPRFPRKARRPHPPAPDAAAPAPAAATETPAPAPAASETPAPAPAPAEEPMVAGPGASGMPGDEITQEMADEMNEAVASGAMPREGRHERGEADARGAGDRHAGVRRVHQSQPRDLRPGPGVERRLRAAFPAVRGLPHRQRPRCQRLALLRPARRIGEDFLDDWVDLGDIKGNVGAQNYRSLPAWTSTATPRW